MASIYVGNLSFTLADIDVRALFEQYGPVNSVKLITDRDTGRSRGFAFVDMEKADANQAISPLNGVEYEGRTLRVNEAKERNKKTRRW